jgi:hypothetical protein
MRFLQPFDRKAFSASNENNHKEKRPIKKLLSRLISPSPTTY